MIPLHLFVLGTFLVLQTPVHGNYFETYRTSLTKPIYDAIQEIEDSKAMLEMKYEELEKQKQEVSDKINDLPESCRTDELSFQSDMLSKWDLEACLNLTGDWKDGLFLALEGAAYALNVTKMLEEKFQEFSSCHSVGVFKILHCYYQKAQDFLNDMKSIRKDVKDFVKKVDRIEAKMEKDFRVCLGIPELLSYTILRHLEHSKCEDEDNA